MHCQLKIIRYLIFAIVLLTANINSVSSQQVPQPKDPVDDKISPSDLVVFTSLKGSEFFPGGQQTGTIKTSDDLKQTPTIQDSIIRKFTWKRKVSADLLPTSPKATYTLAPVNGRKNNPFAYVDFINDTVQIVSSDSQTNTVIVQGQVDLVFLNIAALGQSGSYSGTLSVCLLGKSNECI